MSFGLGRATRLSAPETEPWPAANAQPAQPVYRRLRLTDAIYEAFQRALSHGDLATAEDLVNVLEAQDERTRIRTRLERRGPSALLESARQELQAKKAARQQRY